MPRRCAYCHLDGVPSINPNGSYLFTGRSTNGTFPETDITLAHGIGVGAYTLRWWAKPILIVNLNYGVWSFADFSNHFGDVIWPKGSGGVPFVITGSGHTTTATIVPTASVWHHVVWTRDGSGNTKWYFDSVDVTQASPFVISASIQNKPIIIGGRDNQAGIQPCYLADFLLIQGTAWSSGEVSTDYTNRRAGDDGSIVGTKKGYWPLDGKTSAGAFGSGSALITNSDQGLRDVIGIKASGTNGTTSGGSGLSFDSATYADWTALGINISNDVVMITGGTGVTPGVYFMGSIAAGAITLATTPGASGSNIVFAIGTMLNIWGAPLWIEDTPFPPPFADAGGPYSACGATATQLNGTDSNAVSVHWTTDGDGVFSNANILTPTYTPGATDIFNGSATLTLTVTGYAGQTAVDTATITIGSSPDADAGGPYSSCAGTGPVSIVGATTTKYNGLTWTTSGTGTFTDSHVLSPIYNPSAADVTAGSVTLTLTITDPPCPPAVDTATLSLGLSASCTAGGPYTSDNGAPVTIADSTAANYSALAWTLASGTGTFDNAAILHPVYTPSAADIVAGFATIRLVASGSGSCSDATATALIIIPKPAATEAPFIDVNVSVRRVVNGIVEEIQKAGTRGKTQGNRIGGRRFDVVGATAQSIPAGGITSPGYFIGRNMSQTETVDISIGSGSKFCSVPPMQPFCIPMATGSPPKAAVPSGGTATIIYILCDR